MSYLDKVTVGGTTYDIQDTAAQNKIASMTAQGTASGNPAVIADALAMNADSAVVTMRPIQTGTPSPSDPAAISGRTAAHVTRSGKNLWKPSWFVARDANGTTSAINADGSVKLTGESTATIRYSASPNSGLATLPAGTYTVSVVGHSEGIKVYAETGATQLDTNGTFTLAEAGGFRLALNMTPETEYNENVYIQVERGSAATAYEAYSGTTLTASLGGTVYGGTVDVVSGVLTQTWGYIASYDGETLPGEWMSSMDEYSAGGTPTTGAAVAYVLASPVTSQLTAQALAMLAGENVVSTDGDSVSVGYRRPVSCLPAYPSAAGTYSPRLTVADGAGALAWAEDNVEALEAHFPGNGKFVSGTGCTADGTDAHAEGASSSASGNASHAEGSSEASGRAAHSEGEGNASGDCAHAEGYLTVASGDNAHAGGSQTIANHACQHVFGEFNEEDPSTAAASVRGNYVEIVGNGTNGLNRSNARTLDWSGNEALAGSLTLGAGTLAEVTMTAAQLTQLLALLN